jgi:hypothetical protein
VELTVGPHTVTVWCDPATSLALAREGKAADSDPERLSIRIRHDLALSVWRETLLHELLHHIIALTPLAAEWDEDTEERVVRALSPYLAQSGMFSNVSIPDE